MTDAGDNWTKETTKKAAPSYGVRAVFVPIHKALALCYDHPIESVSIEICRALPPNPITRSHSGLREDQFFLDDAKAIVDALGRSLPGKTFDLVFTEMARRKACELTVPIAKYWVDGNGSIRSG